MNISIVFLRIDRQQNRSDHVVIHCDYMRGKKQ